MNSNWKYPQAKVIIARIPKRTRNLWWLLGVLGFMIGIGLGVGSYFSKELGMGHFLNPFSLNPPFSGREQVNILLIGCDDIGDGLADTLMVARVDAERGRVGVISIPRDTRANIPGTGVRKINAAHALGGTELTRATVSQLLDMPIDYYVEINSAGLAQMVEAVGGIEVDVEKRMRYRDRAGDLNIRLEPGLQRLNGEQAVGYVRFRYDALGDIGRIRRQQEFLRALAKQLTTPEMIPRIPVIAQSFLNTVETSLSARDLVYLAKLAKKITPEEVPMAALPGESRMIRGVDCFQLDLVGVRRTIAEVLYGMPCRVEVVDASGDDCAKKAVELLEKRGVEVISTRLAPEQASTRIIDHHDRPEKARELLRLMACEHLVRGDDPFVSPDFTIEVGHDFNSIAETSTGKQ
jgi:LCP family protein required for cell wall assembly